MQSKVDRSFGKLTVAYTGAARTHFMALGSILLLLVWLAGCSTAPPVRPSSPAYRQVGLASYYASKFHGRRTASGERYDQTRMTAAHPTLPFDTLVEVVHLQNGRRVQVRINDRGPFIKGRIIDLSYAAAKKLGMLRSGVAKVRIRVVPR